MRKRSKYRPKPVILNPIAYVMESNTPISQHDSYWLDLRIKNSMAMASLFRGQANRADMDTLVAMHNICEALWQMGKGTEYSDVLVRGKVALLDVCSRGVAPGGRFILKAPEMQALNDLMELHDAQMEASTVRDLEKALALARNQIANKKAHVIRSVASIESGNGPEPRDTHSTEPGSAGGRCAP